MTWRDILGLYAAVCIGLLISAGMAMGWWAVVVLIVGLILGFVGAILFDCFEDDCVRSENDMNDHEDFR